MPVAASAPTGFHDNSSRGFPAIWLLPGCGLPFPKVQHQNCHGKKNGDNRFQRPRPPGNVEPKGESFTCDDQCGHPLRKEFPLRHLDGDVSPPWNAQMNAVIVAHHHGQGARSIASQFGVHADRRIVELSDLPRGELCQTGLQTQRLRMVIHLLQSFELHGSRTFFIESKGSLRMPTRHEKTFFSQRFSRWRRNLGRECTGNDEGHDHEAAATKE